MSSYDLPEPMEVFIDYDPDVTAPEAPHPDITVGPPPATISEDTATPVHPHASTLTVTAHASMVKESD